MQYASTVMVPYNGEPPFIHSTQINGSLNEIYNYFTNSPINIGKGADDFMCRCYGVVMDNNIGKRDKHCADFIYNKSWEKQFIFRLHRGDHDKNGEWVRFNGVDIAQAKKRAMMSLDDELHSYSNVVHVIVRVDGKPDTIIVNRWQFITREQHEKARELYFSLTTN